MSLFSLGIGPSVGGRGDLRKGLEIFFFQSNNPASLNQISIPLESWVGISNVFCIYQ